MPRHVTYRAGRILWALASAACSLPALAQPEQHLPGGSQPERKPPIAAPDLADPVLKLLEAAYLSEDERKNLRVFHGVWKEEDLDTPQRKAAAALIRGTYDDPSLSDPSVPAEDRAEAAMIRSDFDAGLAALGEASSARAVR